MCFGELSGYFQRTTLVAVPTMPWTQIHATLLLYVTCAKLSSRFAILFGILTGHRKHTLFACDLVCTKMSVAMAMGYKIIVTYLVLTRVFVPVSISLCNCTLPGKSSILTRWYFAHRTHELSTMDA